VSVRVYSGPHDIRGRGPSSSARALPWLLAVGVIGLEIAYPLVEGRARDAVTVATVLVFFLATVTHAFIWRGFLWTFAYTVVTVGGGLAVEAVGLRTTYPFGSYDYANSLGPKLFDVPVVIPLAWAMMAYPALLVARRLAKGRFWTPVIAAWALASWDLFLDPMMVADGHWHWHGDFIALPGIDSVPVSNYIAWFISAFVMMLILDRLDRRRGDDGPPYVLYLWTYVSSVVANAFFFHRPEVAIAGGLAMGLVVLPFVVKLWAGRP
jgi:uncharacterized membrane protein